MTKQELIRELENLPEERLKTLFPYPTLRWDIDIPDPLFHIIREYSNQHQNIAQQIGFFSFNSIRYDPPTGLFTYLEYKSYWRRLSTEALRDAHLNGCRYTGKYTKSRISIKPGKLIKMMFPNACPQTCEAFANAVKQYQLQNSPKAITEDVDILYAYHDINTTLSGTIGSSCMRYSNVLPRMHFYRMLGLRIATFRCPDTGKIRSRALVWPNITFTPENGETQIVTFLDRIYYTNEEDLNRTIAYAEMQGYLYRRKQGAGPTSDLILSGKEVRGLLKFPVTSDQLKAIYPYMDTLPFLCYDGSLYLSNQPTNSRMVLQHLDGYHALEFPIKGIGFPFRGDTIPCFFHNDTGYPHGTVDFDADYQLTFNEEMRNELISSLPDCPDDTEEEEEEEDDDE
jgi:hypothetical protein